MSRIKGVAALRRRRRAAPGALQEAVTDQLRKTVEAGRDLGRENIDQMFDRRTGISRRFYRASVSVAALSARFGYVTRAGQKQAFYARFLNDGTRTMEARPFHDNAVEAVEREHAAGMLVALRRANSGRVR